MTSLSAGQAPTLDTVVAVTSGLPAGTYRLLYWSDPYGAIIDVAVGGPIYVMASGKGGAGYVGAGSSGAGGGGGGAAATSRGRRARRLVSSSSIRSPDPATLPEVVTVGR